MAAARSSWKDPLERISPGCPEDLLLRTSSVLKTEHLQDLNARPLREELNRILTRPSQKGLYRSCKDTQRMLLQELFTGACARPCKDPLDDFIRISTRRTPKREDFTRISARSLQKELCKIMQGPLGEDFTRITTRSSHKDLYKIMQGPLREDSIRISTRSSHKDLYQITQGPLRKDVTRISTRSSHKDNLFCASLRGRNAHGHVTRVILCANLQVKCRRPKPRQPFCSSLRSRNAHGHVTRAILCENLQVKMPQTKVARQTLCEPAQSRCTYAEIFAGEQIEHSDQAPALTPTVRTLQCGHTVWGKNACRKLPTSG